MRVGMDSDGMKLPKASRLDKEGLSEGGEGRWWVGIDKSLLWAFFY